MKNAISAAFCLIALSSIGGRAAGDHNLLPNPSFEMVEPPPPAPERAKQGLPEPQDTWLPRTWNLANEGDATWRCPDDPLQAHSGRRCIHVQAGHGRGFLRYGPMPVVSAAPWKIRFWARGSGTFVVGGFNVLPDKWARLPQEKVFSLGREWTSLQFDWQPDPGCHWWMLDIASGGPTDAWLDDVSVTHAGLQDLDLPPAGPLEKDDHTLLYLSFEEPLNEDAFFLEGAVSLSKPGGGRFGRGLQLGAGSCVACSANENLEPSRGTIEVWVKFLSPGSDSTARPIVSIPGPEGMWLGKDQYAHISFHFSTGWRSLSSATALGYAGSWQPGVWRHFAACWDKDLMELFVDGKLIAWDVRPQVPVSLGPELDIGSSGMELDDLRISNVARYRLPVPE